ncbi:MAG: glycosyltransferase family 4 protein [Symploca sp. SIO1C4]|uniref:Glycosyltransferase family 4 protein n=1 Tax=Symploca sp. SIO1C4 TaxID=2607765 RepID=A0A6B3N7N2_9CYAN|nr:glycosyltransferase family 4 protein [Symploca sp. SIO1C4]
MALPGTDYVPHAPLLFANTLPLLPYLAEDFEVTLVLRKALGKPQLECDYLTILDSNQLSEAEKKQSTANFSPTGFFSAWKYLKILDKFPKAHAKDFDLVIERQWSLVGSLSNTFRRYGVPAIFVVEAEFYTTRQAKIDWRSHPVKQASTSLFTNLLPQVRRQWIRNSSGIVVETEQMKSFLIEKKYASYNKPIYSIPNGIEPQIFFPRDRHACRQQLGISQDSLVLTYVGSLNRFIQEPGPIIEALGREQPKDVVLYVIGDGNKRKELENIASKFGASVVFKGRLPQPEAALYVGAANLCLAPYNKALFPEGKFTSASLKVCEYLACGRPVLTIPCERMEHLLSKGEYGFLVENEVESYREFFQKIPSSEEILEIENLLIENLNNSTLRAQGIVLTWKDIAEMYKKVIRDNSTCK